LSGPGSCNGASVADGALARVKQAHAQDGIDDRRIELTRLGNAVDHRATTAPVVER
jgi:hypothetical protein